MSWRHRVAALSIASAVTAFLLTLYRSATYPPALGLSLAVAGALFLCSLVLLHQIHAREWPGLAHLGFAISAVGLGLWVVGGTMRELDISGIKPDSVVGRFILEVLRGPQAGWGLFCLGLVPIGAAAITKGLSLPVRLLLPLGSPLLLEAPLKYLLGERAGGLTILAAFGLGWLAVGILVLLENHGPSPRPKRS